MSVVVIDGFKFYQDINRNPESLIISGVDLVAEINYIKARKIKSIALSYFESSDVANLDFLIEVPFIHTISITDLKINYLGLYNLLDLKSATLSVSSKNQYLDYSKFKKLEYLSIDWNSNFPDLSENKELKELVIWKFKPKSQSFQELRLPKELQSLEITESNILNLEGLDLDNLKKFEGHYCNRVSSVQGIRGISKSLNTLILDYCKKLSGYDELMSCGQLEKLILGDCGEIPNLAWLRRLKKIKHFSFYNTKLGDGDTSPCFGIQYVSFKNEKHYTHKVEEFRNPK